MRKYIINNCMDIIKKYNPGISNVSLEEIEYGLVSIYILITKLIVIFSLAFLIGILKEVLIFTFIYAIIRTPSFGIHASKSWICLIASTILFIGIPYISMIITLSYEVKFIMGILGIVLMFKNSPADTHKRPIINPKRRLTYKVISTLIACVYVVILLNINNNFTSNCLLLALLTQCVIISPITYMVFKMPYNNYKNYCTT